MFARFAAVASVACVLVGCRKQTKPVVVTAGGGFTASCNGDFPSWISSNPPTPDNNGDVNPNEPGVQKAFELAQNYPLGSPVLSSTGGQFYIAHYDPPQPNVDAPWRSFNNLTNASQRTSYLNALRDYILAGISDPSIQFDATRNNLTSGNRLWFHVPMMTGTGIVRREPYHGVTMERSLRPAEQTHWLTAGSNLRAVAIGYYNFLGGYTIGQVFKSSDLSQTDPTQAKFIDGTLVFKLLFAEYVPSRIIAPDPLAHAPSWWVQDPSNPTNPLTEMRLLQVDVAVKDDHFASTTGWVFATFVYDESLTSSESNAWKRLTPVGIMWGNDPTVTSTSGSTLNETWINPALPTAFTGHLGRAGRLIGPVDDPVSSCLSCHSTAEVDMSQQHVAAFLGAANKPVSSCNAMDWFRNLASGTGGAVPFGHALTCPDNLSPTGLTALDYSLQLSRGVGAVYGQSPNTNPCVSVMGPPLQPLRAPAPAPKQGPQQKFHFRVPWREAKLVTVETAQQSQWVGASPPETELR